MVHRSLFTVLLFGLWTVAGCGPQGTDRGNLDLDELFASHGVEGAFLLQSLGTDQRYTYNPRRCEQGFLPASTFKIVNSIIGLETGAATDAAHLFPWDSVPRAFTAWNQDHTLKTAFQASCVPCYQSLARSIGAEAMREWVQRLRYGKMDIRQETLSNFWLVGQSEITPYEQLDFLMRLAQSQLPIQPRTEAIVKDIMILAADETGMVMRGKTGWAIVDDRNIGWFVGMIERGDGEQFIFVLNQEAKVGTVSDEAFMASRKKIVGTVLQRLEVI